MPIRTRIVLAICLTVVTATTLVLAQPKADKTKKRITRAKPPVFTPADTDGIFFKDVFKEALVGERPANLAAPASSSGAPGSTTDEPGESNEALYSWHELIAGEIIEDEIKKLSTTLTKDITTPTKFTSGGYRKARVHFTMLATLFAIAGEHKDDVRWKKDAPEIRDYFARAALGATVSSQQSYSQAKNAKTQLEELVRGITFSSQKPGEVKTNWEQTADRVPLMKRLETSANETLPPMVSSASEFSSNKEALLHEASLIAIIGEVLAQEGMTDADDEGYQEFARKMRDAAKDIVSAVELDNYDSARAASGALSQSCDVCHNDWR